MLPIPITITVTGTCHSSHRFECGDRCNTDRKDTRRYVSIDTGTVLETAAHSP
jgi:hypothetical protein